MVALLIVGSIAFAITLDIFDQQGIHILGGYAHVDVRRDCYLIEVTEEGYSATEKSTLIVSGYLVDKHFSGYINLEAYPFVVEDCAGHTTGYITGWNEIVLSNYTFLEMDRPEWESKFEIFIMKSDLDIICINIKQRDGTKIIAVCAESAEDAVRNYEKYLEHYQSPFMLPNLQ